MLFLLTRHIVFDKCATNLSRVSFELVPRRLSSFNVNLFAMVLGRLKSTDSFSSKVLCIIEPKSPQPQQYYYQVVLSIEPYTAQFW